MRGAPLLRMANLDATDACDAESQEGSSLVWKEDIASLPPLPTPIYGEMRAEAACGCTLVLGIITVLVGSTHASLPAAGTSLSESTRWAGLALIYGEAITALMCLLGLMWGDPGAVKRTPENCFPLPEAVAERLHNGHPLDGMSNLVEGDRTFCVRCLVWRPEPEAGSGCCGECCASDDDVSEQAHHCATCQRCVTDFDHHCGVFGRCIAGRGLKGNMKYFNVIILMAVAGFITCIGSFFVGTVSHHPPPHHRPRMHSAGRIG